VTSVERGELARQNALSQIQKKGKGQIGDFLVTPKKENTGKENQNAFSSKSATKAVTPRGKNPKRKRGGSRHRNIRTRILGRKVFLPRRALR